MYYPILFGQCEGYRVSSRSSSSPVMSSSSPEILILPRYTDLGPSSRLRMSQFVPSLNAHGYRTMNSPFFSDDYLRRFFADGTKDKREIIRSQVRRWKVISQSDADVLWIEKDVWPLMPASIEKRVWNADRPYVLDLDDAVFHTYDQSGSALVRALLGKKFVPLMANSASVVVGNEYLADYTRKAGAENIEIIPTVVEPSNYPVEEAPDDGRIKIGWIGTPKNARYLDQVVAAVNRLANEWPLTLVTIGAKPIAGLDIPQVNHAWSEEHEGRLLGRIDVGVMPLPDDPYERGKCGYKLIQYMAAGKPVIASPVGVNKQIVSERVGLLADSEQAWIDAIVYLARDRELRREMGLAARERVETDYSVAAVAPRITRVFDGILGRTAKTT